MKLIKHILFILFFLVFSFELIQNHFAIINAEPLYGGIIKPVKPTFTLDNWFSGMYQDSVMKFNESNLDIHPFLIRLHNQVGYSLYNEVNLVDAEVGKNEVLFESKYIISYMGIDFDTPLEDTVKEKVRKLVYIKSELKKRNIDLIVAIVPGKASFFPECIPAKYDISKKRKTYYDAYIEQLQKQNCDYIDFKKYLLQLKPTSKYPFFTRGGTHWSMYAGVIAADSLFDNMKHLHHIDMINYTQSQGEVTTKARDTDDDIERPMNLLFHIPSYPMYYPNIVFQNDATKTKPNVLIIGDSFIWNWINYYPFFPTMFDKQSCFWYYNKEIWWPLDPNRKSKQPVEELNFEEQTMHRDFILLESTECNLTTFANHFIEKMYAFLKEKNKLATQN